MSGIISGIKGSMKKKNVAVTGSGDPYWSNVTLLLTGDSNFADLSSGNTTVTQVGGGRIETGVKKFGAGCIDLSTANSYLVLDPAVMNFGTGDFTMEAWIYKTSATSWFNIFGAGGTTKSNTASSGSTSNIAVGFAGDGSGNTYETWLGGSQNVTTVSLPTAQWVHVAFTRSSGTVRTFINGTVVTSYTNTNNISTPVNAFIGTWPHAVTGYTLQGYIDEIRFTKGVARYTANYTVPSAASPTSVGANADAYWSNVSLLLKGDGSLTDSSTNTKTLTTNGTVSVSSSVVKYGTGSISLTANGSTNYDNYLSMSAAHNDFVFGTGDFTVESWIYINGANAPHAGGYHDSQIVCYFPTSSEIGWMFGVGGSTTATGTSLTFTYSATGNTSSPSWYGNVSANYSFTYGQWYHVAASRSGTTTYLFVNGTQIGSGTLPDNNIACNADCRLQVGERSWGGNYKFPLNGYIDDLRITKGVARYTAAFTPPASLPTSNVSYHPQWGNRYVNTSDTFNISASYTTSGSDYIVTDAYGVQWKIFANFANTTPTRWGGVKYKNVTTTANTGVISQMNGAYATSTMATNVTAGNIYTDCVSPNSQGGANRCSWHTDSASDAYPNVTTAVKSAISAGNATFYDSMTASSSTNFCASMYFEPPADTTEVLLNFGSYYGGSMPNSVFVVNKATGALVGNPIVFSNQSGSAPTDLNGTTSRNVVYRHTPGYVYFVMEMNYTIVFSQFILIR
jgi:hypothetical protein